MMSVKNIINYKNFSLKLSPSEGERASKIFLRNLNKFMNFGPDIIIYGKQYKSNDKKRVIPFGFTTGSILDNRLNTYGFMNQQNTIHLGGINIAKITFERELFFYANPNIFIKLHEIDKVKRTLLNKLKPDFKIGKIFQSEDATSYELRMNNTSVKKIKEVYEKEIKLIVKELNKIDRKREKAIESIDKVLLGELSL